MRPKNRADIRFGHETDAETEADHALHRVAANVMAFNHRDGPKLELMPDLIAAQIEQGQSIELRNGSNSEVPISFR
jgi:hypothetical protein